MSVIERLNAGLEGRYRVEQELGAGGMATVFLAQDLKHNRKVALKVLRPELAATLGADRFLREIEIAAGLRHPHILPLYDSGTVGDAFFYVMPVAEGESLRERLLRDKQLPIPDALRIGREVADALAFAHSRGVVHRDIKPENILLESGHAVIADFGIARAVDATGGEVALTETGVSIGTPTYMSPEQAAGERDVDGRSDLYSLACVVYEMLTGNPPFTGKTVESLIRQHLTADPQPVTVLRPSVPGAVASSLLTALAKNPSDRFQTAAEFGTTLETSDARPVAAAPAGSRRTVTVAAAAFAVMVASAAWFMTRGDGGSAGESAARDWILVAEFDGSAQDNERDMAREFVRTALDQSSIVATVSDEDLRRGLEMSGRPDTTRIDVDLGRELAVRASVRGVVTGQIDKIGNTYPLVLRVIDADSGAVIVSERAIAQSADDLISTVDDAVRGIRRQLGERRQAVRANRPLQEVMTPSFEAYGKFVEMEDVMRTTGNQGRALQLLREALAIDPEFASARLGMWARFINRGWRDSARAAIEDALAIPGRLTEVERMRAEASLALVEWDVPAAVRGYEEMAARYPGEEAFTNLGVALGQMGRTEEALDVYRRAPSLFGRNTMNVWNQSEMLLTLGRFQELDALIPDMPVPWQEGRRQAAAMVEGRFDLADSLRAAALRQNPPRGEGPRRFARLESAMIGVSRGRVEELASSFQQLSAMIPEGADPLTLSQFEETRLIHTLSAGLPIPASHFTPRDTSVYAQLLLGVNAGLDGDTSAARQMLAAVRTRDERDLAWYGGGPLVLEAAIAAGQEEWETVSSLLAPAGHWNWPYSTFRGPHWAMISWLLLAEGYERTGQLDSAAAYYGLLGSPSEYVRRDEIQRAGLTYSFAHFHRGRILTQLGRTEEARQAWLTFLDAFTDPDPDYEWMVTEANEALARLAGESPRGN